MVISQGIDNLPSSIRAAVVQNENSITKLQSMLEAVRNDIRFVFDQTDCVDSHGDWLEGVNGITCDLYWQMLASQKRDRTYPRFQ